MTRKEVEIAFPPEMGNGGNTSNVPDENDGGNPLRRNNDNDYSS